MKQRRREGRMPAQVTWTPFVRAPMPDDPRLRVGFGAGADVFVNNLYQVARSLIEAPPPFGKGYHLSIKRIDRAPMHDWRDLFRIKCALVSDEAEAVELYPAASRLVDTSNQYHLWVWPQLNFPFGFEERLVTEVSAHGAVQRPFPPDWKPTDLKSRLEVDELHREFLARAQAAKANS